MDKINCYLLFIALIGLFSCKSNKSLTGNDQNDKIRIGNGGGFVGKEQWTELGKNGEYTMWTGGKGKIKKNDATQLFLNISNLSLFSVDHMQPGNLYQFVEFRIGDQIKRISWDANKPCPIPNVNLFYKNMNSILQKSIKTN